MTILGTVASSFRVPAVGTQTFDSIASFTTTANTTSVSFTSIPGTYKHLVFTAHYVTNGTDNPSTQLRFNGDTGNNYNSFLLIGDGNTTNGSYAGAFTYRVLNTNTANGSGWGAAQITSGGVQWPGAEHITIADYTNTSYYKSTIGRAGNANAVDANGTINIVSNVWKNTAAITSITLVFTYYAGTTSVGANSTFALYGVA